MIRSNPLWSRQVNLTTAPIAVAIPTNWREIKVSASALSLARLGTAYAPVAVASVNGVTTLNEVGAPTGGSVVLWVFPNDVPAASVTVNWNDAAAAIKTSLVATGLFAVGDITAAGGALNAADVTLTWTGVYAATVPPIILFSNSLTGGVDGQTVNVRTTTNPLGNGGYVYVAANAQESWVSDAYGNPPLYLYAATVTGTGTLSISAYA